MDDNSPAAPSAKHRGRLLLTLEVIGLYLLGRLSAAVDKRKGIRPESLRRGFETNDGNIRGIFLAGALLLTLLLASMVGVGLVYQNHLTEKSGLAAKGFRGGATHHTSIEDDWVGLDAENARHLTGYRWIDKRAGVVQIPIGRAMEILAGKEPTP